MERSEEEGVSLETREESWEKGRERKGRDGVRVESWKEEREGGRKGLELEWNHGKKEGRDGVSVES